MSAVMVIGSGGREHALAWKLGSSPKISRKIAAPGNDGFPSGWERWELDLSLRGDQAQKEFLRLASRAKREGVALAVIGPDQALADGIVDVLEENGIRCFGPSASAARIESSKAFAKEVMKAASVPTARFFTASSAEEGRKTLKSVPWSSGWVVKADGLALGKGVRVCSELGEALQAVEELMAVPSAKLVIEERLQGEEISWLAFCDGETCSLFEPARDHKSLFDAGKGPNTGGMGAFSPVPGVPSSWEKRMREEVFLPVLREMKRRGTPFKGILYAGLMCDFARDRYWVIEFNARFGDPEAQVLLARMSGDLLEWCEAVSRGELAKLPAQVPFRPEASVVVIAAAAGYPGSPEKGRVITGIEPESENREVPMCFVAGATRSTDGNWITAGGRVLGVMGLGRSLGEARERAYGRLAGVSFQGMQFRRDIAGGKA